MSSLCTVCWIDLTISQVPWFYVARDITRISVKIVDWLIRSFSESSALSIFRHLRLFLHLLLSIHPSIQSLVSYMEIPLPTCSWSSVLSSSVTSSCAITTSLPLLLYDCTDSASHSWTHSPIGLLGILISVESTNGQPEASSLLKLVVKTSQVFNNAARTIVLSHSITKNSSRRISTNSILTSTEQKQQQQHGLMRQSPFSQLIH